MPSRAWTSIAVFILVPLVCWAWIAAMAHDMYGPMTGASAWMMTPVWDARHLLLLWAMWAVMMTGMMLPSAAPMILLSGRERSGAFGLGYLFVWTAFSARGRRRVHSQLRRRRPPEIARQGVGRECIPLR